MLEMAGFFAHEGHGAHPDPRAPDHRRIRRHGRSAGQDNALYARGVRPALTLDFHQTSVSAASPSGRNVRDEVRSIHA